MKGKEVVKQMEACHALFKDVTKVWIYHSLLTCMYNFSLGHSPAALECLEAVYHTFHGLPSISDKNDVMVIQINAYIKRIQDYVASKPNLKVVEPEMNKIL